MLAEAAATWIIVADYRKNSHILGTTVSSPGGSLFCIRSCCRLISRSSQWKQGIPIEVVPFAYAKVLHNLRELGSPEPKSDGTPGLSLRMGKMKAGPVVSDNGNFIIDAPFPPHLMKNPADVSFVHRMTLTSAVGED